MNTEGQRTHHRKEHSSTIKDCISSGIISDALEQREQSSIIRAASDSVPSNITPDVPPCRAQDILRPQGVPVEKK